MVATRTTPLSALFARIKAEMVALGVWYSSPADEAAMRIWLKTAWLDCGCNTDFAIFTQPANQLSIQFSVRVATSGHRVNVYWGDGSTDSVAPATGSNTSLAKTYATGALRPIIMLGRATRFESTNTDGKTHFGGSITWLRSLTYLGWDGSNTGTGSVTGMPLTYLSWTGSNTGTGSVTGMPLTYLGWTGSNTGTGSVVGLTSLTFLYVFGYNTLSGSVAGLTSLTVLSVGGSNTLSGSVAGLTSLTVLSVTGSNTLSGSVAGLTSLTFLSVTGYNTLSGSVAGLTSLTFLSVYGYNTLSGSVAGLTSLTVLYVGGSNTISGSVAGLTSLTVIYVYGSNTLSGSVAGLTSLTVLGVGGSNTLSGWGSIAASAMGLCQLAHGGLTVLDATEVNAVLAGFWANRDAAKSSSERVIEIGKDTPTPNAAPTGQGLTDKAALQAYRSPNNAGPAVWTVTTN